MTELMNLAKKNLAEAQSKQKAWYDKNAHVQNYEVGQKVLLYSPPLQISCKQNGEGHMW